MKVKVMICQGWEKEGRGLDFHQIEDTIQFVHWDTPREGRDGAVELT